jgi:hypothetical protein
MRNVFSVFIVVVQIYLILAVVKFNFMSQDSSNESVYLKSHCEYWSGQYQEK